MWAPAVFWVLLLFMGGTMISILNMRGQEQLDPAELDCGDLERLAQTERGVREIDLPDLVVSDETRIECEGTGILIREKVRIRAYVDQRGSFNVTYR